VHTRAITAQAFQREDGLWDIDAHITDTKDRETRLAHGVRPAGAPIHDLWLRLTLDEQLTIVAVEAVSDAVPYPGHCDAIGPDYGKLAGLNLRRAFRNQVWERMGGTAGCTHLTELAQILPTVAIQAFSGRRAAEREAAAAAGLTLEKPFQLGACKTLRLDGEAVAKYYPHWAMAAPAGTKT
jgi:hypothetical protein